MFERFTLEARQTVVGAQYEARLLHSGRIGTEHLLLALLRQPTPSGAVLARHGLTSADVAETVAAYVGSGDLDAEALAALGIDLDAVRSSVEAGFGPGALDRPAGSRGPKGHIPFTPRAKKVIELSLREALAMKSKSITDGHIALGLLREGEGLAMKVLADRGVDTVELRRDLTAALRS
ncbi:Clp protease N-terminal domain-containing protein [Blastococcus haudaquaticus]|uniref:Clp amino terminal domain-containing protein, pathogenicity island component n=1 Tax=Blastococcus haudaquaticus TaxID=1938745 RepID=A0A286H315_9ACTN|nr:Clp protease N-terminal domain-containing protein [Blastococcus haudaquaticus]SOE02188.1 Clp amino terminal domain-containing protein, pathogenicity island component [Blastococcus haudaquaticus]